MPAPHWSTPVLRSVLPVTETAEHVTIAPGAIESVASWMAYEAFVFPRNLSTHPSDVDRDPDRAIDRMLWLWKTYHATFWPHHLTPTIMY